MVPAAVVNMKKEIKEWGNSLVITFSPEERRIIGLSEGDIISFTIEDIETKEALK